MPLGIHKGVHMKGKIENFLRRLYNDLNEDYRAAKEDLEAIRRSIEAFESSEISVKEQASYIAAQSMEIGCSACCKRIENALDSIKLLIQPGASVPAYAENLLIQYYVACKNAAKDEGRTDMDNVLSVQILRIESQLKEAGYAIFGGLSTFKKIKREKAERKLKKAEAKLKKAQEALRRLKDPAAAEDHADETNCADPVSEKNVGSNAQADAEYGDALAEAKENKADPAQAGGTPADAKENKADPAQAGGTPADAKENTANSAAQAEGIPADAKEGNTAANSEETEEKSNEDVVLHVIIFI